MSCRGDETRSREREEGRVDKWGGMREDIVDRGGRECTERVR